VTYLNDYGSLSLLTDIDAQPAGIYIKLSETRDKLLL